MTRLRDASDLDRARFTELERRIRAKANRHSRSWSVAVVYLIVLLGWIAAVGVSAWRLQ